MKSPRRSLAFLFPLVAFIAVQPCLADNTAEALQKYHQQRVEMAARQRAGQPVAAQAQPPGGDGPSACPAPRVNRGVPDTGESRYRRYACGQCHDARSSYDAAAWGLVRRAAWTVCTQG
ncbi:MAG: hypothetical protein KKD25_10825 [Gammaproteobacteria bacterium]|nr:hypothetical protein [Gammaproteobacteria bacterium]MBU0770336.1 hypothetical protein [Gammaproteobacteria bacterium]MBU0858010.1 hypothetical protein [Gammaproteobacteria bacterium]MBU1847853.1 hypothetical protein [Gammaproteobacteria bacterium]